MGFAKGPGDSLYPHLWKRLVLHYAPSVIPYDVNSTRIKDFSGLRRHGTVAGAPFSLSSYGRVGPAIACSGAGSAVTTGLTLAGLFANPAKEKSVMMWVYCDAAQTSPATSDSYSGRGILADTGNGYYWITRCTISGADRIWCGNWSGSEARVGITYTADQWVHIAYVQYANTIYAYKNGVLSGTAATGDTGFTDSVIRFGTNWNATSSWQGKLDDVRFYDRRLEEWEIAQSAAGASPLTPMAPHSISIPVVSTVPDRRRLPGTSYFWMTRR